MDIHCSDQSDRGCATISDDIIRLVWWVAYKMVRQGEDVEDLNSIAMLNVLENRGYWKPELGRKWKSFAVMLAQQGILKEREKKRQVTTYPIEHHPSYTVEHDDTVEVLLASLSDEQKKLVHDYYTRGLFQREIAVEYGVSHQTIDQRLRIIKKKLRRKYESLLPR